MIEIRRKITGGYNYLMLSFHWKQKLNIEAQKYA